MHSQEKKSTKCEKSLQCGKLLYYIAEMERIDLLGMDCCRCIPQHTKHTHYLRGNTGMILDCDKNTMPGCNTVAILQQYKARGEC